MSITTTWETPLPFSVLNPKFSIAVIEICQKYNKKTKKKIKFRIRKVFPIKNKKVNSICLTNLARSSKSLFNFRHSLPACSSKLRQQHLSHCTLISGLSVLLYTLSAQRGLEQDLSCSLVHTPAIMHHSAWYTGNIPKLFM